MTQASRRISLKANELLNLDDARGSTIRVARGQVWMTQYGDLADHVLEAGDSWAIERNGRTVLQAQQPTIVDVVGDAASRIVVPVAATPEPGQLAEWLGKVANDWIDRRWAPYV
jgi:hypothetical protein